MNTTRLSSQMPLVSIAGPMRSNPQAGLTLLELMISLSLGMLLLVGIGTVFVGSNQTNRVQESNARVQETGRYALESIGRSIRQAGYADIPATLAGSKTSFTGTPINGANGAGAAPDTITLQYDGTNGDRACNGDAVGVAGGVVQDRFNLDLTTTPPRLRCESTIGGVAGGGNQPLLDGVEDLQVLYGIDTDGNQSADRYVAAPGTWTQVVSARVCVLVQSEGQGITTNRQTYLNCAGALGTATGAAASTTAAVGDSRLRRAFVGTFNLRNRVTLLP